MQVDQVDPQVSGEFPGAEQLVGKEGEGGEDGVVGRKAGWDLGLLTEQP